MYFRVYLYTEVFSRAILLQSLLYYLSMDGRPLTTLC